VYAIAIASLQTVEALLVQPFPNRWFHLVERLIIARLKVAQPHVHIGVDLSQAFTLFQKSSSLRGMAESKAAISATKGRATSSRV